MIKLRSILPILTFCLSFGFVSGQEICNNALDDDGDGLIDLNDPDCECDYLIPSSLIPNPSFEEQTCCPQQNARLDCAVSWIQASHPTTDYVHTCGNYLGNTNIPAYAPLPFPDGEGGVGFRDGQQHVGVNYKEYVGACLKEAMIPGTQYRLDFFVGFQDNVYGSTELEMAIFASSNCADLPFGGNSNTIGCPVNSGNYVQIGEQVVSGSDEWVNVVFEFEADQPYEVLILGPSCNPHPNYLSDPYFYLDRLAFAESDEFGNPFEKVEGQICEDGITIYVKEEAGENYQWYKDGIALLGENQPVIHIDNQPDVEGVYLCVISNDDGCYLTQKYRVRIPPYYEILEESICENESYIFGEETINQTGYYERTIEARDGCDSIIQLSLEVLALSHTSIIDSFCKGDVFQFLDIMTSEPGQYTSFLVNAVGCDSIIKVDLTEIPFGEGLELPEQIDLELGESVTVHIEYLNPDYTDLKWLLEDGESVISGGESVSLSPIESTMIYINALDEFGCPVTDSTYLKVRKNNYDLFVPNIFTPNGDRINDVFTFFPSISVDKIEAVRIYDRWGNLVYKDLDLVRNDKYEIWDGTFDGQEVVIGVYTYMINARFIDGYEKVFSGDITLIR